MICSCDSNVLTLRKKKRSQARRGNTKPGSLERVADSPRVLPKQCQHAVHLLGNLFHNNLLGIEGRERHRSQPEITGCVCWMSARISNRN